HVIYYADSSAQYFADHRVTTGSHPSYRHEEPASPNTCVKLSRNLPQLGDLRFDDLQPSLAARFLSRRICCWRCRSSSYCTPLSTYSCPHRSMRYTKQASLWAMAVIAFGAAEFAAEAAILGAEVTLAPKERGGGQSQRGGGAIHHLPGACP